jgi:hypothetical protein
MFTTPKLLEALADKIDLPRYGITGIFCGGTELTPQYPPLRARRARPRRRFRAHLRQHAHGPRDAQAVRPEDNYEIIYHAPQPRAVLEVVDPNDPAKHVAYGQVGRVRLTTLTRETVHPRLPRARRSHPPLRRAKPYPLGRLW